MPLQLLPRPFIATLAKTLAALGTAGILCSTPAHAVLFTVPKAELTAPAVDPATIVRFDEVALGSTLHNQTIKGFTFVENTPNAIVNTGGPGNSNNLTVPLASSGIGYDPTTYVLTINMPAIETRFGFGFAVLSSVQFTNALTIRLFDGATDLGALVFGGSPDPTFTGGFAGIASTVGFTRAQITFDAATTAFAIDNVAARSASVPELSPTLFLLGITLVGLAGAKRRGR